MQTETLIVGGGLTGLSLAYRLEQAGHDYRLIEGRDRLGGRIKSLRVTDACFDLGPSWIWPGQSRVFALLDQLGLGHFEQWSAGAQVFQHANGTIQRDSGFMSMAGSYRIKGGTAALTDALADRLDPARVSLGAQVTALSQDPLGAVVDGTVIAAKRIVLAIPPRLAATLHYAPALPPDVMRDLQGVPTWMGAHAKFVAVYDSAFWRAQGLSGDASSRRGPMVEIHDASPHDGRYGALFGFMGLPADARANAGEALTQAALAQLAALFGPKAATPLASALADWSQDRFTATPADAHPPAGHPAYGMPATLARNWEGKLIFAVTELAPDSGGLIEGALAAADGVASDILNA